MRGVIAIALAILLAIAAAAPFWGWWRSPIPTFLVFTPVLHGMMLGAALMWLVERLRIRSPRRRALIGITAGVVSVSALTFAQYVTEAYDYHRKTQRAMAVLLGAADARTNPLSFYDANVLKPVSGRGGVIGYLRFRDAQAWRRQLRAAEAILVVALAGALCVTAGGGRGPTVN